MPRKKTKHSHIPCESVRKATFNRRVDNLLKKGKELSTLCGVQTAIIIHKPSDGNSTTLWPSPDEARRGIQKFLSIPEQERLKKMVLQEKYLSDRVEGADENFKKVQSKNEKKETKYLMNQVNDDERSINELEIMQLATMKSFADEKLKKLQKMFGEADDVQGQPPPTYVSPHPLPSFQMTGPELKADGYNSGIVMRTPVATLMEDLGNDKWFLETISGVQNNTDSLKGTDQQPEATAAASTRNVENSGGFPYDLDQLWSSFFAPPAPRKK